MLTLVADCFGRSILFPLHETGHPITAGSLPENQIYLPYRGVSRRHFELRLENETWQVVDLGSRNGTFVNERPVECSILHLGDTLRAGIVELSVCPARGKVHWITAPNNELSISAKEVTDKLGYLPIQKTTSAYEFPELVFPEDIILGHAPAMFPVYQRLHSLINSEANVLLIGETGSGKEVIARTLHLSGNRKDSPFIAVNCGAIPAELAEAELFGIKKRVATEVDERPGKFALADGGILFLDELSALPAGIQAKILRALETKLIEPIGADSGKTCDFRLIAATNEEPRKLMAEGRLREDLYYRIATIEIRVPPLRQRKEDLLLLIPGLLYRLSKQESKSLTGLTQRLYETLLSYNYPGNTRELRNILHNLVIAAHPGELLDTSLLPPDLMTSAAAEEIEHILARIDWGAPVKLHELLDEVAKNIVTRTLERCRWNVSKSARFLEMTPPGLKKMMDRLGIALPAEEENHSHETS